MNMDIYEIGAKKLLGEDLTEDEASRFKNYNVSYDLVRFLVTQKLQAEGMELQNFHFTPGESFLDTPIIDTVNSLVEIFAKTASGEIVETEVD